MQKLVDLTELDRSIHELRQQLHLYPGKLKELDSQEKKAQAKIDAILKKSRDARDTRRHAETEADSLRDKIRKYKIQQGSVKTNRELEAITHEIEQLESKIEELDTLGLESLEIEELSQEELVEAEEARDKQATEIDRERSRIAEQTERKRSELADLQQEHSMRLARLPEGLRDLYQLLNEKYPGTAVVPVKEGACGGCSMNLVRQRITEVKRGDQPIRCDNCTRLLYDPGSLTGTTTVSVGDH